MKLQQLIYFLETAKQEHIGKAAEILSISPSAISHSITSLEQEFGRQIFTKKGKNIQLTAFGKIMAERTEFLIKTFQQINQELHSGNIELRGKYSFAATHVLSEELLTPVCTKIQEQNPNLKCELSSLKSSDVVQKVIKNEIDLGLCFSPQSNSNFNEEVVYKGNLIIAVQRNHPILLLPYEKQLDKLSKFPAIVPKSFNGITNCESHAVLKKFNIAVNEKLSYDHYGVAVRAIESSTGWSLIPDIMLKIFANKLHPIYLYDDMAQFKISAIWPQHSLKTRVLNHIINDLKIKNTSLGL